MGPQPARPQQPGPPIHSSRPPCVSSGRSPRPRRWSCPYLPLSLGIGLLAFATAWTWGRAATRPRRRDGRQAILTTGLAVGAVAAMAYPWGEDPRQRFFARFPDYYRGWLVARPAVGTGRREGRLCGNGPSLFSDGGRPAQRGPVRQCRRPPRLAPARLPPRGPLRPGVPATWPEPRPGWDRIHPDYDAWLANLRDEGIQLLVVTRAKPEEGPHNVADRESSRSNGSGPTHTRKRSSRFTGSPSRDPEFRLYRVNRPVRRSAET